MIIFGLRTKRSYRYYAATFVLLALLVLLVAACQNPFADQTGFTDGKRASGSTTTGMLNIGVDTGKARTVTPENPDLTRYRLAFNPQGGQEAVDDQESTTGDFPIIELEEGEWEVSAFGYALFQNEEHIIADDSISIVVEAGKTVSETFVLESDVTGDSGELAYELHFTAGSNVQSYGLTVQDMQGNTVNEYTEAVDTATETVTIADSTVLEPGYYLATLYAEGTHSAATEMTVVHIYPNRSSQWSVTVDQHDFVPHLELSGSAPIKVNGSTDGVSDVRVMAYNAADRHWNHEIGEATVAAEDGSWTLTTEVFDKSTTVYFTLVFDYNEKTYRVDLERTEDLYENDKGDIVFADSADLVILSGTAAVEVGGSVDGLSGLHISAYTSEERDPDSLIDSEYVESDGTWALIVLPSEGDTTVYFTLRYEYNSDNDETLDYQYVELERSVNLQEDELTGIDLSHYTDWITMSGSASVQLDGLSVDYSEVTIAAFRNSVKSDEAYIENSEVAADGTWSMSIPGFASEQDVYFSMLIDNPDADVTQWTLHDIQTPIKVYNTSIPDINFDEDVSTISIEGFVDVGTTGTDLSEGYGLKLSTQREDIYNSTIAIAEETTYRWDVSIAQTAANKDYWITIYTDTGRYILPDPVVLGTGDANNIFVDMDDMNHF